MLELVHAPKQARTSPITATPDQKSGVSPVAVEGDSDPYMSQRIGYRISQADRSLRDLFEAVRQFLIGLGDDVQVKELKYYIAFRRIKNFVCLELYPQARVVTAYLKIDPKTVEVEEGFSRDVTNVGHFGTGNLALSLRNMDDFARAQPLFRKSYENS
jgi:predicted transport protein